MNKELLKEWIDALRSGAYTQACGALKTPKGYCCLGVLADLFAKKGQATWFGNEINVFNSGFWLTKLPIDCGLDDHQQANLAVMNDGGIDFETIASYIEENYIENDNNSGQVHENPT